MTTGTAWANDATWFIEDGRLNQFHGLGELGEVTVDHVQLSFSDRRPTDRSVVWTPGRVARGFGDGGDCSAENFLGTIADTRGVSNWAISALDDCRPGKNLIGGLIPRISIHGTFFNVGYGVTLDKKSRGLFVDYGAFTFGIGDSPSGASIFNGSTFPLPRWFPGRDLLPRRIRENVQIEVGMLLVMDSIDIKRWKPQVGIGVKLAEW